MIASDDLEGLITLGCCAGCWEEFDDVEELPNLVAHSQSLLWLEVVLFVLLFALGDETCSPSAGMDDRLGDEPVFGPDCPSKSNLAVQSQWELGDGGGTKDDPPRSFACPDDVLRRCARALASIWRPRRALPVLRNGGASCISDPLTTASACARRSVPRRDADVSLISDFVTMSMRQHGHSLWLLTSHNKMQSL